MKRILAALAAFFTSVAFGATLSPITLLNPSGSSSGQAIVSTGASSAPVWGSVGLNGISAISANSLIGNATNSSAAPTAVSVTGCNGAAQALQWTNGTGFGCNSAIATSGANANITSLSGITTPLSVPQGGTGAATLAQYNMLAGNGTSAISAIGPSTSGFVLTSNGASAFPSFQAVPGQAGRLLNVQAFTSSGTYTPTSGATKALVIVQSPGGGGGGCSATAAGQVCQASGGSGGSYAEAWWTSLSSQTVTIGTTGSGGAAGNNNGATGGTTSLGTIVSCPGGVGGVGSAGVAPPSGQSGAASPSGCTVTGATTLVNKPGGVAPPAPSQSTSVYFASQGGSAMLGSGTGGTGVGFGAGGAGAAIGPSAAAAAGSNAAAGEAFVFEYQ